MSNSSRSLSIPTNPLRGRVLKIISLIRLRPFDTSTAEGRANERMRRVIWTAAISTIGYGINTLAIFISVPITLGYLGSERYGLWMTITSVLAILGFADLGIGNVVLNLVAEATGKNDVESARKNISSAFFLLLAISIGLALVFGIIYPFVDWPGFFNVTSGAASQEAGPAMIVFMVLFLISLPVSIIPRVQNAFQEGYISGLWAGGTNILGLILLIIFGQFQAGLPWLIIAITGTTVLGILLNSAGLFFFQRPQLVPRLKDFSGALARNIVRVGFMFLILQVTNAVTNSADNIIIARILGADVVTNYAIPAKLFSLVPMVIYMMLMPLWPAYGEATARGDEQWARATLVKAVGITFMLSVLASLFLLAFGKPILQIWTSSRVPFSLPLMASFGIWITIQSVVTAIALYLNAIKKIGFQVIFAVSATVVATLTKIVLVRPVGLPGILWGNIMASVLLMLIPYSIFLARKFRFAR